MPEFKPEDANGVGSIVSTPGDVQLPDDTTPLGEKIVASVYEQPSSDKTYSQEELNDPNAISVTIADTDTPVVVLFGPPACGKTMTLVRLARYLRKHGFTVGAIDSFRPSYDEHYKEMCAGFDGMINSNNAAAGTSTINFMLMEVLKNGRRICQLLEAPGEHYFDPGKPDAGFPAYVNNIISCNNRKVWTIFLEPSKTAIRMDDADRRAYVDRVEKLGKRMRARDKAVILFNKVDETNLVYKPGRVHLTQLRKDAEGLYPRIFDLFKNVHPITRFFRPYYCRFVAFQSGTYTPTQAHGKTFQEGADEYPRMFWETLMKVIKG